LCKADRGASGDFEEIYGCPDEGNEHIGQWDAIVTCFFIDTVSPPPRLSITIHLYSYRIDQAKNIVNYLRTFHKILVPGGVWINLGSLFFTWKGFGSHFGQILNLGPLLWHWENSGTDPSIELDLEQVKALAEEVGFEIQVRCPASARRQMIDK